VLIAPNRIKLTEPTAATNVPPKRDKMGTRKVVSNMNANVPQVYQGWLLRNGLNAMLLMDMYVHTRPKTTVIIATGMIILTDKV
jgi:hypothetical protein